MGIIIDVFLPPAFPDSSYQVREHNIINFEIIDDFENDLYNFSQKSCLRRILRFPKNHRVRPKIHNLRDIKSSSLNTVS